MSLRLMSAVWQTNCRSHTEKLVFLALADNANDEGHCWPSIPTIVRKSNLSIQGVLDQIASLEERGCLKVDRTSGKANHYWLTPVNAVDGSSPLTGQRRLSPPINGVDPHPSTALMGPVNAIESNRKEPPFEPSIEPRHTLKKKMNVPETSRVAQIESLHKAYCFHTGLNVALDSELGQDRWGRRSTWNRFIADGFSEADLLTVVRHIKTTMKEPFRTKCLNFRKLIENTDYFGEALAEAGAVKRNAIKKLSNREEILKATHRLTDSIPAPKTPKDILPDPNEFAAGLRKMREAL